MINKNKLKKWKKIKKMTFVTSAMIVATPIVAAVSCGAKDKKSSDDKTHHKQKDFEILKKAFGSVSLTQSSNSNLWTATKEVSDKTKLPSELVSNETIDKQKLKEISGVDLTSSKFAGSTLEITAQSDNVTGTIIVTITLTTPGASTPEKIITLKLTGALTKEQKNKRDEANKKQAAVVKAINNYLNGKTPKVKDPSSHASKIAATITNIASLKKATKSAIDLSGIASSGSTITVSATGDDSNGDVTVTITVKTPNATKDQTITLTLTGAKFFFAKTSIAANEFYDRTSLTENVDFSKVTSIGTFAFGLFSSLPEDINFSNVTRIDDNAFYSLTSLPENIDFSKVTTIGNNVFFNLTSLPKNNKSVMELYKKNPNAFPKILK